MQPLNIRIGIGHDTHRVKPGGPLLLGGVEIPVGFSLDGHSDADVLLHSITDSLLGAAGLGDIGELFPDTASENFGRDSAEMLAHAWNLAQQAGFQLINLDCIVFAQQPKLSPYKNLIVGRIAQILDVDPTQINVKAKTGEKVGPLGMLEILQAESIALLFRPL